MFAGALTVAMFACVPSGLAQAQKPQVLQNHVRPEVSSGQAALVGAMPLAQRMNFSMVLPLRNQADLDSFLARIYDPSSPDFHHFLSVDEFTQRYGPTADDYQAVVAFARAQGFTVGSAPANRLVVPLTGTVSQIESAFNVRMNLYQHPTENRTFFSPDREPSLNLSVPVAHIAGLDNFALPHPMVIPPSPDQPQVVNVTGSGPGGSYLGSDMRAAYYGGTTLDGNGQAVGLLEFDGYNLSDVNLTFANAGQTYNVAVNNVLLDGATGLPITPGGTAEVVLDIVQAIGMAPGLSQVRVYMGTGSDDANILNSMASENIAKQISSSWSWTPDDPTTDDVFFKEFAAQGQAFFAASGDDGAYDATISPYYYPQEDAYITAVGGTHLTTNGAGGAWESETAWNTAPSDPYGSGGGISPDDIAIPSWQSGVANTSNAGSTTYRNVPDVAMEGDFDNYNCEEGSCSGGWAGTSFAAPRWAGFMALVNEQAVEAGNAALGGIGFLNPSLYPLAEGTPYATDFHDVTSGNNDTDNQPTFWSAVAGYDLVTGWGSPGGQHLIDDLAGPQVPGFWLLGSPATVGVLQGSSASTTISVTDAGGFTGNVTLAVTSTLPTGVTAAWGTNPTTGSSVLTFTAAANAPASTTPLTITGTSGSLKVTTIVTLAVHAPTFTLTPSAPTLGISQGNSGTSTITVTPEYGFTGNVNLSISGLPTGVTASFSPTSTATTSTLTVNVGSSVANGTWNLTITGTSGSLTVTTPLVLTVHEPTFTLDPPSLINVGQGASGNATVYILPEYGFSGSVNLSVSGLPTGVTASFSPNPATVSAPYVAYTTLTLTVGASVPAGTTPITITGTSGSLSVTSTMNLVVQKPTFTLSSPLTVDMGQGATTSTYVTVIPQYGFAANVTFSITGLPSGVTASWNPNPASNYSILTLTASSSTAVGSSTLTITGTSGSITATSTTTLTIHQPSFTVYGPTSVDIGQGASTNTYVAITPLYGFNGNVTFSVTGLPTGVTALWNPNPTTGSTNLTLTASSSTPTGTSTLTITGTSGSVKATATTTLTVHAPSFTVNTYSSVSMGQGSTGTDYVYITPAYGFSGNVNLSVSGLPSGVTASFSPNPTTGNSTLTFTSSSTAAVGTSTVTITGTSGTLTASSTVTLTVNAPSFTIGGPGGTSIGQGTTTPLSFYVSPQYGFTGSVTFAVSGLPSGVTASFAPNPTTNTTVMTLTASSTTAVGQATLTVTGTSGSLTSTTTVALSIYTPTFTLYSCCIGGVGQGTSSTGTVSVYPQYGFSGNVTLSISGLPSGVTASFSPNPVTVSGAVYSASSTLTLTVSSTTAPGQYPLTITGTAGALTVTTPVTLSIYPPSFTMYGGNFNMGEGATATSGVYIYPQYGFTGSISLSISGLPTGVTASFAPNPVSIAANTYSASSTLTVTSSSAAVPGQYTLTVTGTSGTQTVTASVPLTISAPGFTLYCSNCYASLNQGATTQATVTVSPQFGFAGSVNLAVTGLPSGVTGSFSPNPTTATSTLTLVASAEAPPVNGASYTITGSSGSLTATTTGSITINAQGFSLMNAPGEINLSPGGSGESTVDIIPVNGFTGNVSFSAAGLPSGVTAAFSPNPATATTVMTLTAASNAVSGSTTVGISGTSGSLTAATSVVVKVNAAARAATATTLQIAAGGSAVQSVAAGTAVTLTATVSAGSTALKSGQVNFCTGVATGCDPTHLIGTAQLTSAGTATLKFIPGMGVHSYRAVFVATNADAGSTSTASPLTVTAAQPTTTTMAVSGSAGNYTLTATVAGAGAAAPTGTISFLDTSNSNSVLATAALGSGKATLAWGNPQSPATGTNPDAIAVADFNRDGIPDLAIANSSSATVTVLLGKGDGTFTATATSLQTGASPSGVVVGDFNGDGIPDLAVANESSNNVSVFLGNGDGTFTAVATLPETGSGPAAIEVGDFNGDGILDLATGNSGTNTVTVLLGNGDGTFTASPFSAQTNGAPRLMMVGDFNGDGILDLAVVSSYFNNPVTILLGNGDGSFTPAEALTLPQNTYPYAAAVGDFNQDGKLDLAIASYYSSSIYIYLGNGDGTFTALSSTATGINDAGNMTVTDLNGDGKPDLVETNGSQVGILLGNGDGTFATATTMSGGNSPYAIAVADFNGDGTQDLAITNTNTNTVDILTAQLSQTTTATATGISPVGAGTHIVEASYPGDTGYQSSVSSVLTLQAELVTPTVTVTPSSASISTTQALTVTITVAGKSANPTPTGSIVLTSGSYTSAATTLASGSAAITIPAGSLAAGSDSLTATYTPDTAGSATFSSATGASSVTVTNAPTTPVVTVTPSTSSITTTQALGVTITVSAASGKPTPTGSVVLTGGGYTSAATLLSAGSATINIPAESLGPGNVGLFATYTPDATSSPIFNAATGDGTVSVARVTPALTVTPSATSITTAQAMTVAVTVSAGSGNPVPTGLVILTSGTYNPYAQTLTNGSATFSIPAGSLAAGSDTLSVAYTPDNASATIYNTSSGTGSVSVTPAIGTTAATVTVTASAADITNLQSVTATVTVAGPSGQPTPTGSVTLSSGSYSAQQALSAGGAGLTIPAGALAGGADTLTAAYSGDPSYAAASGTTTVTVVPVLMATPTLSPVAPGSSATGNVTLTAGSYSGTMALTCTMTSSPAGAQSLPTCNLSPASLTLTSGGTATSALNIGTTAASTASLVPPAQLRLWKFGGTGSLLAVLVLFGIPARRRRWASMLIVLFFVAAAGAIGCGGGSGSSTQPPPPTTPATTAGSYTFAIKATDSNANVTASANVTLTVQ